MKTAEYVSPKHPDKIADQISDAIVDLCLSKDPDARVAVEVLGGHGRVRIIGESSLFPFPLEEAKRIVNRIAGPDLDIEIYIEKQSPEIAQGVDTGGAGDQGIMIGYACDDNPYMLPQELALARELCQRIYQVFPYDGKTQITLDDSKNIMAVVASFQNAPASELEKMVKYWLDSKDKKWESPAIYVNPAGDWKVGGFDADTGLTGRKLMVDNYGPQINVGGGCFSGKDGTKVDRSGAYIARKIAVDLLVKHNAKAVKVKLAYAIGVADPVMAEAMGVKQDGESFEIDLRKDYALRPADIIKELNLKEPQFEKLAAWGHFGSGHLWDKPYEPSNNKSSN